MCIGMCIDMHIGICIGMCIGMGIDMRIGICIGMCIGMGIDMRIGIFLDMYVLACVQICVQTYEEHLHRPFMHVCMDMHIDLLRKL